MHLYDINEHTDKQLHKLEDGGGRRNMLKNFSNSMQQNIKLKLELFRIGV